MDAENDKDTVELSVSDAVTEPDAVVVRELVIIDFVPVEVKVGLTVDDREDRSEKVRDAFGVVDSVASLENVTVPVGTRETECDAVRSDAVLGDAVYCEREDGEERLALLVAEPSAVKDCEQDLEQSVQRIPIS